MENRLAVPQKVKHKILYYMHVRPVAQLGLTLAYQAPLSIGFPRQEYWSGLSCPSPGDLPNPGIEPVFLMSPALSGGFSTTSATWEVCIMVQKETNELDRQDSKLQPTFVRPVFSHQYS